MLRASAHRPVGLRIQALVCVMALALTIGLLPQFASAQAPGPGTVSGTAWTDVNLDGVRNRAEAELGVERVTAVLYRVEDGRRVAPEIGSTETNVDGRYLFGDVAPGAYQLQFRLSDVFALTYQDAGDDDLADSDANQFTSFTDVFAVDEELGAIRDVGLLLDGESVRIEGIVWEDWNGDHEQQIANERGLGGVSVALQAEKMTKKKGKTSSTWNTSQVVFSDARNGYRFSVPSSDKRYRVQIGQPAGYQRAEKDATPSDLVDSDVGQGKGRSDAAKARDDRIIDAGLAPLSEISDYVWVDADQDGIQDEGEGPVDEFLVALFESFPDTKVFEEVDALPGLFGQYAFTDVPPGVYKVAFFADAPLIPTVFQVGDDRYLDSDISGWAWTPAINVPDDVVDPAVLAQRQQQLGWRKPGAGVDEGTAGDDIVVGGPPEPGAGPAAPPDLRQSAAQWWDGGFYELDPDYWRTDVPGAGGVAFCESGKATKDPKAEIVGVSTVALPGGSRTLIVELKQGHERAYSFATIFAMQTTVGQLAFIYELHDGVQKVGQLDLETGEVTRQNGDLIEIVHVPSAGRVFFGIDSSLLGDGPELGFVRTFHTAKRDQDTRCHGTQPFELPQRAPE